MSRIKVTDLPTINDLTPEQLKEMFGAGRFKPSMEALENRIVLTGNIDYSPDTGVLTIDGDDFQDVAQIRSFKDADGEVKLSVDLYSANDAGIKIDMNIPQAAKGVDYLHKEFNASKVSEIVFRDFDDKGDFHVNDTNISVTDRRDVPDEMHVDDNFDRADAVDLSLQELSLQRESDESGQSDTLASRMAEQMMADPQAAASEIARLMGEIGGCLASPRTGLRHESDQGEAPQSTDDLVSQETAEAVQETTESDDISEPIHREPFTPPEGRADSESGLSDADKYYLELAKDYLVGYGYSEEEVNEMSVQEVLDALDDAAEHALQGSAKNEWIYSEAELKSLAEAEMAGENGAIVRNTDGTTSIFVDGKLVETVGPDTWQEYVASWVDKAFGDDSAIAETAAAAAEAIGSWFNEYVGEGSDFEQTVGKLVDGINSFVGSIIDYFSGGGETATTDADEAVAETFTGGNDTSGDNAGSGQDDQGSGDGDGSGDGSGSDDDDDDSENEDDTQAQAPPEQNDENDEGGDDSETTSGTPLPDKETYEPTEEWLTSDLSADERENNERNIENERSGGVTDPPETDTETSRRFAAEETTYTRAAGPEGDDSTEDGTETRPSHSSVLDVLVQQQQAQDAQAIEGGTGGHVDGGRKGESVQYLTDQQLQDVLIQAGGGHTDPPETRGEDGHLPPTELTPPQVAGPGGGVAANVEDLADRVEANVSQVTDR